MTSESTKINTNLTEITDELTRDFLASWPGDQLLAENLTALESRNQQLAQTLRSVEIPGSVELDLGLLTEAEQAVHVRDMVLGDGIDVLNNPEELVAKISVRRVEKLVEEEELVEEEKVEAEAPAEAQLAEQAPTGEDSSSG